MSESSKVLNEKRQELIAEMKVIGERVTSEKRNFTNEEKEQLATLDEQQEDYAERAETLEKVEHVNSLTMQERRAEIISSPYHQGAKPFNSAEERNKAIAGWMYHGTPKTKPEYWRASEREGIDLHSPLMRFDWQPWAEQRTNQTVGSTTAGGFTVAADLSMMANVEVAMKNYGQIFNVATVIDTQTGANLPYPLMDDTSNAGEVTAEAGTPTDVALVFAQNTLKSYKYDSGFIKVSWELMQDSVLDLAGFIGTQTGIRIGRGLNSAIINTGAGTTEIQNILSGMTKGFTSTSTKSAGPLYGDLVGLYESIDYAYQQEPGCGWLFSQNFRSKLRSMVDSDGRPLMMSSLEGIALGLPNSLIDEPYYVNAAVPTWDFTGSGSGATGNKCAIFGDLKKILIRRVTGGSEGGLFVQRFNERFADAGLVAFLTWGRFDAILSDAGQHPVKYLQAPSS